jgi:hypothetical protein
MISGSSNVFIGGDVSLDQGNVISGNTQAGIEVFGGASNTKIRGNFIGTDVSGTLHCQMVVLEFGLQMLQEQKLAALLNSEIQYPVIQIWIQRNQFNVNWCWYSNFWKYYWAESSWNRCFRQLSRYSHW